MRLPLVAGLSALAYSSGTAAACSSGLTIDNFSKWSSNTNSLNYWTSDDGSMTTISASGGVLSFKPAGSSYFYETLPCEAATTNGYNSIQFSLKGPAGGSLTIELQTQASCTATTYKSYFYTVTGLTGATQTVNIPLSSFAGANLNAITSIVWESFSSTTTTWQLSNVLFGCSGVTSSSSSSSSRASSSSSSSIRSSSISSSRSSSSSPSSSSSAGTSTQSTSSKSSSTLSTVTTSSSPSGTCSTLLIDDFISQSRLTFLFYNALIEPSSDDGSMKSIVVGTPGPNRVTLTPTNTNSYFYSEFGCLNAQAAGYGGISMRIKAPAGTTFTVEFGTGCSTKAPDVNKDQTTAQLGWTFDGTEKLYTIPFSKYAGLDTTKLFNILFTGFNKAVSFGPMAFYCGSSGAEYVPSSTSVSYGPTSTVPAPTGTAPATVIDTFKKKNTNDLGFWHGYDNGMTVAWGTNKVTLSTNDPDLAFYTQVVGGGCTDWTKFKTGYLHIAYSGSTDFTVSLQQHNDACNDNAVPYPATWDSLETARYASGGNIYMPISHFNIDYTKTIGFSFHGFFSTKTVSFTKIEIVDTVPAGFPIPNKLPSGEFVFKCKRPGSFAFAIDDGDPQYAQQIVQIVKKHNISVTFFTLGAPLLDTSTNLSNVYHEMQSLGHQIAMHSFSHPKMEGLPDYAAIDYEYNQDISILKQLFNGYTTKYFRPPFGTEGARMRQRLAATTGNNNPTIVEWSVDVQDYLWAQSSTPEKQLTAFQNGVNAGGDLVVLHYLYASTVNYLDQFITMAKATGKQLMRVDQCMMDPEAPPL